MMAAERVQPLRGELRRNEPLSGYTTWRVGGPAKQLYRPADLDDLANFLAALPAGEELLWLGLGSNLLVRDGGFDGTVILLQGRLNAIRFDGPRVDIEAGAACAKVARSCARAGLTGGAFLAGIPGTMGGALAMNAGAFGGETWRIVEQVTTVDRAGHVQSRHPDEYRVGYREVQTPGEEWFVACRLRLEPGDTEQEQRSIRALLDRRAQTQPTGLPSCGSTFRNPPDDFAARLIEASGLKGYRVGGAEVSPKHANFMINTGSATAAELEALIAHVRAEVLRQQGIELVSEYHAVGKSA
jgi:UDP-N-acetylmuramate dehydrogenase